jgi:hypothetical protein
MNTPGRPHCCDIQWAARENQFDPTSALRRKI